MTDPTTEALRRDALAIHAAGVAAVDPAACLGRALAGTPPPAGPVRVFALGKAAAAMAHAAVRHLRALGLEPAGGVVVTTAPAPAEPAALVRVAGDHPQPGQLSFAAAEAVGAACRAARDGDEAWVLISGGTSSLVAAPVSGIPAEDYLALHRRLGAGGLPIGELNAVRKRFARWGAGRLLVALPPARVRVFCLSDVPGDDPGDIGSGPCEPDPATAADIRQILERHGLWSDLPAAARALLDRMESGAEPETPKPGHPAFARRETRIVGSNRTAVEAAAAAARWLGYEVAVASEVLTGEAAPAGRRLAIELLRHAEANPRAARVAGGETTVTLGPGAGRGGRAQELALAASRTLADSTGPAVLLAAGTDGRDGPTDAAGAVVDHRTWAAIAAAGFDPDAALTRHDAYPALNAIGALVRTGPTGTNVMDLVVGLGGAQIGGSPGGTR